MASAKELRLIVVTPETTVFDDSVQSLCFPLYDGQIGILPERAPMIGRLGYGELKATGTDGERSYFVDGGFVQVKGTIVTILTNQTIIATEIDRQEADERLIAASARVPTTETEFSEKERDQERARRMLAMARP